MSDYWDRQRAAAALGMPGVRLPWGDRILRGQMLRMIFFRVMIRGKRPTRAFAFQALTHADGHHHGTDRLHRAYRTKTRRRRG